MSIGDPSVPKLSLKEEISFNTATTFRSLDLSRIVVPADVVAFAADRRTSLGLHTQRNSVGQWTESFLECLDAN